MVGFLCWQELMPTVDLVKAGGSVNQINTDTLYLEFPFCRFLSFIKIFRVLTNEPFSDVAFKSYHIILRVVVMLWL